MKLSEAIRLGSLILKPCQGVNISLAEDSGCAMGMALVANGHPLRQSIVTEDANDRLVMLGFPVNKLVTLPCCSQSTAPLSACIIHIFDNHVCHTKDWTLDDLIEWVASVEEDAPTANAVSTPETIATEKEVVHV